MKFRELSMEHASDMVDAALESVSEVNPWMDWCNEKFDIESAESFIRDQIIYQKKTVRLMSLRCVSAEGVNSINKKDHVANVGYWIRTSEAGKGFGTSALKALIKWARSNTNLNRLEVVVAKENVASNRVAQKYGAVHESVARSRIYNNGQYLDANIYSFIK